jgi:hypothetical protein
MEKSGITKVLAADDMEGRDTGSPGLKRAEAYAVGQLKDAGLQPAGVKGFYQPVKFVSRQLMETESSAALVRDGKTVALKLGEDGYFSTRVDLAPAVEAPLVFVGYGLSIPESNFDDLTGLDLKGKVAVLITGAPEQIGSALAAHHQTAGEAGRPHQRGRNHHYPQSSVHGGVLGPQRIEPVASQHGVGRRGVQRD